MDSVSLSFVDTLWATGPAGDRPEQMMMLYGQFVGSCDGQSLCSGSGERSGQAVKCTSGGLSAGAAIGRQKKLVAVLGHAGSL
jgi:hypothetical protein